MRRRHVGLLWLAGLVMVGLAGGRLVQTLRDPAVAAGYDPAITWLYTGDFLYPAVFYRDMSDGYPVRGYAFSGATFAVPELATYAAVRAVAGRPAAAVIVWYAVFAALAVAALTVGLRAVAPAGRRPWVGPLVLVLTAGYLGWFAARGYLDPAVIELLLPQYHIGAVAGGLAVVALLVGRLRGGGWWRLPAAAAATAALALSDRLTGPWLVCPLAVALAVTRLLVPPAAGAAVPVRWGQAAGLWAAVAVGAALGLRLLKWVNPVDRFDDYWSGPRWEVLVRRGRATAGYLADQFAAGNPLIVSAAGAAVVGMGVLTWAAYRRLRPPADRRADLSGPVFLAAYGLSMWAVTLAAVALSNVDKADYGKSPWQLVSRYFLGPVAVGYFGWAVWLACRPGAGLLAAVAAAAVGWAWSVPREPSLDLFSYRPPFVVRLDEECGKRGLTRGLAGYWAARPATLLSHTGLDLMQVRCGDSSTGLVPFEWLAAGGRYWRTPAGEAPRFQFVVALERTHDPSYRPSEVEVTARLGPPAERVPLADGYLLLVYDRPADWRVRDFGTAEPLAVVERWKQTGRQTLELPGAGLWPHGLPAPTPARTAGPGTPPGIFAYGPFLELPAGRYRAAFRVTADAGPAPVGEVDVFLSGPPGTAGERPVAVAVPAGTDGEVGGEFVVRADGPRVLELRAAYTGPGRLTLHAVRLDRLP